MTDRIPVATHSAEMELLGHKVTMVVLDDGTRVFQDTPGFRALMLELGVGITDQGVTIGLSEPIETEVVK